MNPEYTIFIVDDLETGRRMLETTFQKLYTVESFASGVDCIDRMTVKTPDLFLLDVDMPEMDGYALCRHIRNQPDSSMVPVIFISSLDDLESRLAGYDAGGDDFIAKPYKFSEVRRKVEVLQRINDEKADLRTKADESNKLTSQVLSTLGEYAVLVKFLRSLNDCDQYRDLAEISLSMLKNFHLEGALQFRLPDMEMTRNQSGPARPLETSIINQVRSLGTVAEFKNRAAFNFERVTVLINNMPVADSDLCGRLRDHLAIAVETLDSKLLALHTHHENSTTKREISAMLEELGTTVHAFSEKYEKARYLGSETTRRMLTELDAAFANLGMRESQEDSIKDIVQARADDLIDIFDFSAETEKTLKALSSRLAFARK